MVMTITMTMRKVMTSMQMPVLPWGRRSGGSSARGGSRGGIGRAGVGGGGGDLGHVGQVGAASPGHCGGRYLAQHLGRGGEEYGGSKDKPFSECQLGR